MRTRVYFYLIVEFILINQSICFAQTTQAPPATPAAPASAVIPITPLAPKSNSPTDVTSITVPKTVNVDTPLEFLNQIVITGSNLPTDNAFNSPNFVETLSSDYISKLGDNNSVRNILGYLPQLGGASYTGSIATGSYEYLYNASADGDTASVSLRGFKPEETLVLVNGHRMTSSGYSLNGEYNVFDLNTIAPGDIDRIEVLPESSSALYGADAVAGVVNIILKKNIGDSNAITTANFGNTTNGGDSFEQSYHQAFSLDSLDHNGTGMISFNYYKRNSVLSTDRAYAANADETSRGGPNYNANLNNSLGITLPAAPDQIAFPSNYNSNEDTTLVSAVERYGFHGSYGYNFYEGAIQPSLDFSVQENKSTIDDPPDQFYAGSYTDSTGAISTYPNGAPVASTGATVFGYSFDDVGPRIDIYHTNFDWINPQIDIKLGDDWKMHADFNYSYDSDTDNGYNYISANKFENALTSTAPGTYIPNGNNNQQAIDSILGDKMSHDFSSITEENVLFTGSPYTLPGGKINFSLGGTERWEQFHQHYSQDYLNGDFLSVAPGSNVDTGRSVTSAYTEIDIPVFGPGFNLPGVKSLNFYSGARLDNYSDFGLTTNPEAKFRWSPVPGLFIRGGYSTSFRAPSFAELNNSSSGAQQVFPQSTFANNPSLPVTRLQPETAESYSIGLSYTPPFIKGLQLHADLNRITLRHELAALSSQYNTIYFPEAQEIESTSQNYINDNKVYEKSIDFGGEYVLGEKSGQFGQLDFTLESTYQFTYRETTNGNDVEYVGTYYTPLESYPRYSQTASMFWNYRTFSLGVTNLYRSGVDDTNGHIGSGPVPYGTISASGAICRFNLQTSYDFRANETSYESDGHFNPLALLNQTKLTVGVDNVAQFTPPFLPAKNIVGEQSDPNFNDYQGCFVYGAITKKF